MTTTERQPTTAAQGRTKASRREALLGAAVGVSGPALYKHVSGKQAMLAAILLDASEGLFAGGQEVLSRPAVASAPHRR